MNALDASFQWLQATSLRASILAVAILGLQAILRPWLPANWRHALWLPMVLVMVLPALPAVPLHFLPQTRMPVAAAPAAPIEATAPGAALPQLAPVSRHATPPVNWLALGWLAGSSVMLAAGLLSYRRSMGRIRRSAMTPDAALARSLRDATREVGLRREPQVWLSPEVESPAVTGLVRPRLLLPVGFPEGFSGEEARLILLHELTHLKRRDLPVNWLLFTLQALHWFNPILWFAFARMRADREAACDAQVLSLDATDHRSHYGHALLKLQTCVPRPGLNLGFVGIFEDRGALRSRIREISRHRRSHPAWRWAGASLVGVLTLVGATRAAEPRKVAEAQERTTPKTPAQLAIEKKLKEIVIPMVAFEDTSMEEAIDFLRLRSKELDQTEQDPNRKGINFVIRRVKGSEDPPRIVLNLKNATLDSVLTNLANQVDMQIKVDDFGVTFLPKNAPDAPVKKVDEAPPQGKAYEAGMKVLLPIVDIEDATLKEVVDFLNVQSTAQKGPAVVLEEGVDPNLKVKELRLRNVPLPVAIKYCVEAVRCRMSADDKVLRIHK